jgi:hypothetical protein
MLILGGLALFGSIFGFALLGIETIRIGMARIATSPFQRTFQRSPASRERHMSEASPVNFRQILTWIVT